MFPLAVAINGGIFLLTSLVVKLVHVVNQTFLVALMRFLFTGINSAE